MEEDPRLSPELFRELEPDEAPEAKPTPTRKELLATIAAWQALPEDLRQPRSLHELAQQLGVSANQYFYRLAESGEVHHQRLVEIAANGLEHGPKVIQAMAKRATEGHVGAAKVLLDFIRQVITDKSFMEAMKEQPTDLTATLRQTEKAVKELLAFAKAHRQETVETLPEAKDPEDPNSTVPGEGGA